MYLQNDLTLVYCLTLAILPCFMQSQPAARDDLFFRDRLSQVAPENIFQADGYYHWGGSIIKGPEGLYHLYYSRWEKKYSFTGWLTHSEIAHAIGPTPRGPWKFKSTALQGSDPGRWDAITAHNPKIKYFEGRYYLYFISTNMDDLPFDQNLLMEISTEGYEHPHWKVLRENQRTGVATAESLAGPWIRLESPLIQPSGPITTLTVNPAITRGPQGKYHLIVKGDKPNETRFIRNQAIAVSPSPTGPFVMQDRPVIDDLDTEDVSMWFDETRNQFYGIFHAHSFIGMMNSPDGIHWKKATEYILSHKHIAVNNGDTIFPDRMERPFVYVEGGDPQVLSVAVKKGNDSYLVFIPVEEFERPIPNERQHAWQQSELGAIFHYDLHVFDGKRYNQARNRISPVPDYQIFRPENLDTDQWVKTIKDAGFTFALLTATHETGFALFQSEVNPYCMKALDFQDGKGDIVRDFVSSCRRHGIKPGIYLGIRWNSFFGVHDFEVQGNDAFREQRQEYYTQMVEGMLTELCTNYGPLFEIWFDGGADHPENGAPDVLPIVQQYQPNCLFYHNLQLAEVRWGASETGTVGYPCWATFPNPYSHGGDTHAERMRLLKHGDPEGKYWMPAMADAPLRGYNGRHEWFWEPGDEAHIFPLKDLMNMYENSVGRNATLIVGLTPGPDGLLPKADGDRLAEWGKAIKEKYGDPIKKVQGSGYDLNIEFDDPERIDRVIIQENIALGERIRKYHLEISRHGEWEQISTGTSVGHKRIDQFEPVVTQALRLRISQATAEPVIVNFSVFRH